MNTLSMHDETLLSHLAAEHRHQSLRLQSLHQLFGEPFADVPNLNHLQAIQGELQILRRELDERFLQEEQGGLLEEAMACRPSIGPQVVELLGEHESLLTQVTRLVNNCPGKSINPALWLTVCKQFRILVRCLSEYELKSNQLMQRGFNVDLSELLT